jgi:putative oxidoreductase
MIAIDLGLRHAAALAPRVRAWTRALELFALPVLLVAMRLWIADVFFTSGRSKIQNWEGTLQLFQYEYAVPLLPIGLAAVLATVFELAMPVLLAVGLATRLAALPLLAMAMVIQFVLGAANPAFDHVEHFYWMFLLSTLVVLGAGPLSLDHVIARRLGWK